MRKEQIPKVPRPEDLDARIQEFLEKQARSLGVSVDELRAAAQSKPRSALAAERRAARLGKTLEELLAEDRKRLRESSYPGPECLEPHEVEQYAKNDLPHDRFAHTEECPSCDALLRASTPTVEQLDQVLAEVRAASRELPSEILEESISDSKPVYAGKTSPTGRRRRLLSIGVGSVAVVGLTALVWLFLISPGLEQPHPLVPAQVVPAQKQPDRGVPSIALRQMAAFQAQPSEPLSVAYSRGGLRLARATEDNTVEVWDLSAREAKELVTLEGHKVEVVSLAFSPDGLTLVTVSKDKTIMLWNVGTGERMATFSTLPPEVRSVEFSADREALETVTRDGTVESWEFKATHPK